MKTLIIILLMITSLGLFAQPWSIDNFPPDPNYAKNGYTTSVGRFPMVGNRKILVIPYTFLDFRTFPWDGHYYHTIEHLDSIFNISAGNRSTHKEYWDNVSNGKLNVTIDFAPIIDLSEAFNKYYVLGGLFPRYNKSMITELMTALNPVINFKNYDSDKNGLIDCVFLLYNAHNTSERAFFSHLPYPTYIDNVVGYSLIHIGVQRVNMGVVAHEFGHALGFPDTYNVGNSSTKPFAAYHLDLMSNGLYATMSLTDLQGTTPTFPNAYCREFARWTTPIRITEDGTYSLGMRWNDSTVYRIESGIPGEYYLLESIGPGGGDSAITYNVAPTFRTKGLAVLRIDSIQIARHVYAPNTTSKLGISYLDASTSTELQNTSWTLKCYPYNGLDSITPTSNPRLVNNTGRTANFRIYDIEWDSVENKSTFSIEFLDEDNLINTFPYTCNFESGSFPEKWSQIKSTKGFIWKIGSPTIPIAVGGNKKPTTSKGRYSLHAIDNTKRADTIDLISPVFDLSGLTNPVLTFQHAQVKWFTDQDILEVYIKDSEEGDWELLVSYASNVSKWTLRTISLFSDPYVQLKFRAITKYGNGVCLDDLIVREL